MSPRSRRIGRGLYLAAAALVGAGCSPTDKAPSGTPRTAMEIDTVNGVPRVRDTGAAPEWPLTQVFAIGGLQAPDSVEQFGRIQALAADAEHLYVADVRVGLVRVFDTRGRYLRALGRQGQGPGEYGYPLGLGLIGDTVAVVDPANIRLDLFGPGGAPRGEWPYPPAYGNNAVYQTDPSEFWATSVRLVGRTANTIYVRYAPGGASDTLPAKSEPSDAGREPANVVQCKGNGHINGYSPRLAPHAYRVPGPDGLVVQTDEAGYRMVFLTTAGDTARVVERVTGDAGVSDEEWAREEAAFKAWRSGLSGVSCTPGGLQRPRLQRLIEAVFPDADGRIWVERRSPADSTHSFFDAFDVDGALLGTIRTPKRAPRALPAVHGDRFYLATLDSLDVPKIYGFRIGKG